MKRGKEHRNFIDTFDILKKKRCFNKALYLFHLTVDLPEYGLLLDFVEVLDNGPGSDGYLLY